jgi:type II restriction enzyme
MTIAERIAQAREVLVALDFDQDRSNDRSARTLLAMLGLTAETPWSEASAPILGTRAIMDWIRDQLGHEYAPNSRETIRRFTLHQFVAAALVVENPDVPARPINSPRWCYQISIRALELLRTVDEPGFEERVQAYLAVVPGLCEQYAKARELNRIPVTLPSGEELTLSPGGQNVLLKQIVEDFCSLFTPGGIVLYVGDADEKYAVYHEAELTQLGVIVTQRGKMPDLVVYMPGRNWLVLLEAASSHGPVDATRHAELETLFSEATAGLVYVSCFPSREDMRRYVSLIAWETDVWCADNPTHLIHFNGQRFLGPD